MATKIELHPKWQWLTKDMHGGKESYCLWSATPIEANGVWHPMTSPTASLDLEDEIVLPVTDSEVAIWKIVNNELVELKGVCS